MNKQFQWVNVQGVQNEGRDQQLILLNYHISNLNIAFLDFVQANLGILDTGFQDGIDVFSDLCGYYGVTLFGQQG